MADETPNPNPAETPAGPTPEQLRADLDRARAELKQAERLRQEKGDAEAALASARDELRAERLSYAVELQALELGFADVADVLKLADLSKVEYGDDGRPDRKAVKAALQKLAEAKPYLTGATTAAGPGPAPQNGSPPARRGGYRPGPSTPDADHERAAQARSGRYAKF